MKYLIVCLVFILSRHSFGQNHLEFNIYPAGFNIGNIHIKEYGLGHYNFKPKNGLNLAAGLVFSHEAFDHVYIDVGIGLKLIEYKFSYEITNPFNNHEILSTEERYHKRIMWSPHFGLSYVRDKWKFSAGYEPHFELTKNTNIGTRYGAIEIFLDPVNQQSAHFSITERSGFTDDIFLFGIPRIDISYSINSKFSLSLSGLIKPYGDWPLYQLRINGQTVEMPDGNFILNHIVITNKFLMPLFGVSYKLKTIHKLPALQ